MSVPEILRLESQLKKARGQNGKDPCGRRGTADKDLAGASLATRKRIIAATLQQMEFIDAGFTGKLVISFKEGGVNYIEKVEQFK